MSKYILIMGGGAVGSVVRYVASTAIMARVGARFPLGTMVVNVTGSFMIGLVMTLFTERLHLHPNWRLLLVVGFLGGYTTFSTFEYETYRAVRDGGAWIGLLNVAGSVVLGYAAVWIGELAASRL